MGFFKEFKDDLSDAVEEMISSEGNNDIKDEDMINTLTENVDVEGELSKLDGLLEKATDKVDGADSVSDEVLESHVSKGINEINPSSTPVSNPMPTVPISDENAVITSGMTITGDIDSAGSIEIQGRVTGNVRCQGKLIVTGIIAGNSSASEIFADAARVDGEIHSTGTVKIGAGTIVIGNVSASSAVIAGAVKGDIDVQGPVVVDTSAVVMGNVKSRSVQINNGAVIEGFCSQAYADKDVSAVFEG